LPALTIHIAPSKQNISPSKPKANPKKLERKAGNAEPVDEEQLVADFKRSLESCFSKKPERFVPNFTMDWIYSLRKKLAI
jgi:hypothetical protein